MKSVARTEGGVVVAAKTLKIAKSLQGRRARAVALSSQFDRVALFDASGSMGEPDAIGLSGLPCTRWNALCEAWRVLSTSDLAKGRLAAYTFSSSVDPVKGSASGKVGTLRFSGGSTAMCAGLGAARGHQNARLRVLLVSDGEATDGSTAEVVGAAVAIGSPVDTVYVGPKGGAGRDTLIAVARETGGLFRDMSGDFDATKFLEHCKRVLQLDS